MPLTHEDARIIQERRTELEKMAADYLISSLISSREREREYTHFTAEDIFRFNSEQIMKLYVDDTGDKADEVRIVLEGLAIKYIHIKSDGKLLLMDDGTMRSLTKIREIKEEARTKGKEFEIKEKSLVYRIKTMERGGEKYYFATVYGSL